MYKTLIIIENNNSKGFQKLYINQLISLCNQKNIDVNIIEPNVLLKNEEKINMNSSYIYSDLKKLGENVTTIHRHSILARLNNISFSPFKLFFYLGHYKEIQESKKYYNSLKKIIATSNSIKKDLIENYKINEDKIIIAHPGFVPPQIIENNGLKQFNYNEDFIIAMSGVGFVNKGGYVLLKALIKFRKLYPNIKIKAHIIYENYRKNIPLKLFIKVHKLENNVKFFKKQTDMYSFYKNCHCFICPSLLEAFGRVVTEAMYAKRPVVVGSNVGAADIIQDEINGFVFNTEKNSEINLAQKIKTVYDNYLNLAPLVQNGYTDCQKYTWDNFAKKIFEGLYP